MPETRLNRKRKYVIMMRYGLFALSIALIVLMFPKDYKFKYKFQPGKPWMYHDLLAPFDFTINKTPDEISSERQQLLKGFKYYYYSDTSVEALSRQKTMASFQKEWPANLSDYHSKAFELALSVLDSVYKKGLINTQQGREEAVIFVMNNNIAEEKEVKDLLTVQTAGTYISLLMEKYQIPEKELIESIVQRSLACNLKLNYEMNLREQASRLNSISYTRGVVMKNQRVVSKGEIIDAQKLRILESLKQQYEKTPGGKYGFYYILLGQIILISMAVIMLGLFLFSFRHDIFTDNKKIILILSLILLMVGLTSLLISAYGYEYIGIIPLCIVPLVIRTFFDTRLSLFVHLITIIIIAFLVPDGFSFIFLQLIAGIVTIISIVNIEKRAQFFITSVYIFITYSLIYIGMSLIENGDFSAVSSGSFVFFAGSSVLTLLAYPVITLYEKMFGYVTNISLLEYSNTNNKLLRELSQKAPGTFQHSLQVANLAEEAARWIGANSLLVRTGALYHDIGKLSHPLFFTENQLSGMNPHDEMDMRQSVQVIISHVEKGVFLAQKSGIPKQITDFIKTHHGTKRTEYFYRLFKNENPDADGGNIFNYPGPVPSSREEALVMMADAVEAASRSLKFPDKDAIRKLVNEVVDSQIEQNQFVNADITMRDISRVKSVFIHRLVNIFHVRLSYPS